MGLPSQPSVAAVVPDTGAEADDSCDEEERRILDGEHVLLNAAVMPDAQTAQLKEDLRQLSARVNLASEKIAQTHARRMQAFENFMQRCAQIAKRIQDGDIVLPDIKNNET